jgi:hypothetical protein
MLRTIVLLSILILIGSAKSEEPEAPRHWIGFLWDNDVVFETDRYFTNGFKLDYVTSYETAAFASVLHLAHSPNENVFYGFSLGQEIFTPDKKDQVVVAQGDRPFSSSLIIGSSKTILDPVSRNIKRSEFQIGVIGKLGGGEVVQNGIHSLLPTSSQVNGWQNQTSSNLALNYGLSYQKLLIRTSNFHLDGLVGSTLGLPYTYAETGIILRFGKVQNYYKNMDWQVSDGINAYWYSGIKGRAVAYNATIQGSIFNDDNPLAPALNHLVYELDSGLNLSYRSLNFKMGFKILSPEIANGKTHRWGYINFNFGF